MSSDVKNPNGSSLPGTRGPLPATSHDETLEVSVLLGTGSQGRVPDLLTWIANKGLGHAYREDDKTRFVVALNPQTAVPLVLSIQGWISEHAPGACIGLELDDIKLKVKARNTEKVVRRVERWLSETNR